MPIFKSNHIDPYCQFLDTRNQGTFLYRGFQAFLKEVGQRPEHRAQVQKLKQLSEVHKGETRSYQDEHLPLLTVIFQSQAVDPVLLWALSVYMVKNASIGLLQVNIEGPHNPLLYDWRNCPRHLPGGLELMRDRLNELRDLMSANLEQLTKNQGLIDEIGRYRQELGEALAIKKRKSAGKP